MSVSLSEILNAEIPTDTTRPWVFIEDKGSHKKYKVTAEDKKRIYQLWGQNNKLPMYSSGTKDSFAIDNDYIPTPARGVRGLPEEAMQKPATFNATNNENRYSIKNMDTPAQATENANSSLPRATYANVANAKPGDKVIQSSGKIVTLNKGDIDWAKKQLNVPKATTSAEQKPAEQKPAEQKPAEQKPAKQKPAEQKPAEQKPAEQKPAEQKPAEQKPAEQKPAEQKSDPTTKSSKLKNWLKKWKKVPDSDWVSPTEEMARQNADWLNKNVLSAFTDKRL